MATAGCIKAPTLAPWTLSTVVVPPSWSSTVRKSFNYYWHTTWPLFWFSTAHDFRWKATPKTTDSATAKSTNWRQRNTCARGIQWWRTKCSASQLISRPRWPTCWFKLRFRWMYNMWWRRMKQTRSWRICISGDWPMSWLRRIAIYLLLALRSAFTRWIAMGMVRR